MNVENKELWRWVVGYEGLYMVSNLGNVMSAPSTFNKQDGTIVQNDGRMLAPALNVKGYPSVALTKDGKQKTITVHRLVAKAFIPNKYGYDCVNHIDENKTNNTIGNLEWCDVDYNNNYGTRNERISRKTGKPVLMIKENSVVREYPSVSAAYDLTGISSGHISECCNGIRGSAGGYQWKYKKGVQSVN